MEEEWVDYEQRKAAVRAKAAARRKWKRDLEEFHSGDLEVSARQVTLSDVAQVGSKVVIGGGVGLLAGVAGIAVAAGAAEVVVAGVVTKIAGVVGGTVGLSLGLSKYKRKREVRLPEF
ncbi:MAG TPA: hypothetical protein HPP58_05140 [Deltaproteobacteria bacterium]|nr:hypothetical protein [Deltaproteobacteria bacterium]HIJ39653.1 hypothetical protein [Deltaproteobacteria bacterium]